MPDAKVALDNKQTLREGADAGHAFKLTPPSSILGLSGGRGFKGAPAQKRLACCQASPVSVPSNLIRKTSKAKKKRKRNAKVQNVANFFSAAIDRLPRLLPPIPSSGRTTSCALLPQHTLRIRNILNSMPRRLFAWPAKFTH